jgi:hypothetical protein
MTLYSDANFPIPASTESLHADELLSFACAGTWGTAAQRTAIVAEARRARREAGVHESIGDEALADNSELPEAAINLARFVALGGIGIDREYCKQTQANGVSEGAYVEIVGLVARLAHLDVFARGIGVPARQLADPVEDKVPSMQRPAEAKNEGFFTASIPSAPEGGKLAEEIFGSEPAANILRSLSLVPDEARRLNTVIAQEYFSMETIFDLTFSSQKGISRPQLELVAAKVSELNQCFY